MARKVITDQSVKKKKKGVALSSIYVLFLIVLFTVTVLFLVGIVFKKGPFKNFLNKPANKPVEVVVLDEVKDFGYQISDRDTTYYKDEFAKLKEVINAEPIDEQKYAEYVGRMFVNDLYTMSTKVNKYDVGGIEYYHKDDLDDFTMSVMDTLYRTMLDDTYGTRDQKLPEVSSVETVSVTETTYKLGDKSVPGYEVKLKWTYVNDMGYDSAGTVIVVKENDTERWSVVDFKNKI